MKDKQAVPITSDITLLESAGNDAVLSERMSDKASEGSVRSIDQSMLPKGYRPIDTEEFMNPLQLLYFQQKLEAW